MASVATCGRVGVAVRRFPHLVGVGAGEEVMVVKAAPVDVVAGTKDLEPETHHRRHGQEVNQHAEAHSLSVVEFHAEIVSVADGLRLSWRHR